MQFFPSRAVAVELFGFAVHWYGLLYLAAFLLAYHLLGTLQSKRSLSLSQEIRSSILSWAVLGVILGGRMGYVLFYEPQYFVQHPLEILFVWNGGMSSHGGFLGVTLALTHALKKHNVPFLPFLDICTVPIALGLACGRLGNFLNWELYGTVTAVPWAIAIPSVEGLRHPTFFYAIAQQLCTALICYLLLRRPIRPGVVFSVFLLLYGSLRFIVELFREQTYALTDLGFITLTRGQLLSIPILLIGFFLFAWLCTRKSRNPEILKS